MTLLTTVVTKEGHLGCPDRYCAVIRRSEKTILGGMSTTYMLASSTALSPAFIAFLCEFEKSWGRPGNEATYTLFLLRCKNDSEQIIAQHSD